jgi:hypothetical protein
MAPAMAVAALPATRRSAITTAFAPEPAKPAAPAAPKIKFSVQHAVAFGRKVAVVGAPPALGAWDVRNALEMRWQEGDEWAAETEVPVG